MPPTKFEKPPVLESVSPQEFYAELTDPKDHDPDHFCYIIHAINPVGRLKLQMEIMRRGAFDPSRGTDLLIEPEKISKKKLISCSVVSQDHTVTWGETFFILKIPWANFIRILPEGDVTIVDKPEFELEAAGPPNLTPLQIIERSGGGMNEVAVTGEKNGEKVEIIGVGIKLTEYGGETPQVPKEAERMREIAKELGVPVIEIEEKSRILDSDPEVTYNYSEDKENRPVKALFINRNGYRYIFEGEWDKNKLKDVFRSDWNLLQGHNPVTEEEYLALRPEIKKRLKTENELDFLRQIDEKFGIDIA